MKYLLLALLILSSTNSNATAWHYQQPTDELTGVKKNVHLVFGSSNEKVKHWQNEDYIDIAYSCRGLSKKGFYLISPLKFEPPRYISLEEDVKYRVKFEYRNRKPDILTWKFYEIGNDYSQVRLSKGYNNRFMKRMAKAWRVSIELKVLNTDSKTIVAWDLAGFNEALAACQAK